MIIDTSYFTNQPLFIPNAVIQPSIGLNTPNAQQELTNVINSMEYQLLSNALGYEQYTELQDQFNTDGTWKVYALQKWKDLVDGKEDWTGLRYTIGTVKKSLIANYVYYNFLLEDQTYYAITGLQRPDAANSNNVDPNSKLVREWNKFVFMYQGYYECGCLFGYSDNSKSMLSFLNKYPDLYSIQYFNVYELQNVWGI